MNGAAAMPEAFVGTVMLAELLLNVPDAPLAGAVKTTFVPATGLPALSVTVTPSAWAKAVLKAADCGVAPVFAVINAAGPAVFVREKVTVKLAATAATL